MNLIEKVEKAAETLLHWKESPDGKEALAKAEAAELLRRQALVDRAARLRSRQEGDESRRLDAALEKATAKRQATAAALEAATAEEAEAFQARFGFRVSLQPQIDRIEFELVGSASPEIDAFIEWLNLARRRVTFTTEERPVDPPLWFTQTGQQVFQTFNNSAAVRAHLELIRQTRDEARALKLQAHADVKPLLAELRKRIETSSRNLPRELKPAA